MARSNYIYIVEQPAGIVAAFTVKHELVGWLNRHPHHKDAGYKFTRVRDGQDNSRATEFSLGELLA